MKTSPTIHLTFPIERGADTIAHVFSEPVSKAVYQTYYLVLAKVWAQLFAEKIHMLAGPPVALDMLRDIAQSTPRAGGEGDWWSGPGGVEEGFLGEIFRKTACLVPAEVGWETIPYLEARDKRDLFTQEEADQIENSLVFFMVNWRMLQPQVKLSMFSNVASVWGWSLTPSSISDFRSSLATLIEAETSSPKEEASSMIR